MQSRRFWKHWRSRLIAWSMILAVAVLAAVAILIYIAYERATEDLVVERDQQLAFLSAARLKDELAVFSDVLITEARAPEIYQSDVEQQRAALQRAANRLAVFDGGVVLLDNFGKVQAAQPDRPEIASQDWSNRAFFVQLLTLPEVVFSDMTYDGPAGSMAVAIAVPILGDKGEFAGALAGMFLLGEPRASSFYASIVRQRMGQTGTTYLIDGQGRILYDSLYSSVGELHEATPAYAKSSAGALSANRTRDAEGNDIVAARAVVPGTAWTLLTEDDWRELMRSTQNYGGILLIVLLLGMALPALGASLLVRERHVRTHERDREEQELRTAGLIQRTLLPRQAPVLPGWNLAVHYQPAKASGGDFYDFVFMPDGRLMLTLGDIADRSIPATVVIATTRATLRDAARRLLSPEAALDQSNALLCPEMGPNMCVLCVYCVLDPSSGQLEFANAGHLPPYRWHHGSVDELRASGRPLGLLLDSKYEQSHVLLQDGDCLILYGNGLLEARNAGGEMFGFSRLKAALNRPAAGSQELADGVMFELQQFTGKNWVQEDDITLLVLERLSNGVSD